MTIEEKIKEITLRAVIDKSFKKRLISDTMKTLEEAGLKLNEGVKAKIYFNLSEVPKELDKAVMPFILPSEKEAAAMKEEILIKTKGLILNDNEDITDDDLEKVAGGVDPGGELTNEEKLAAGVVLGVGGGAIAGSFGTPHGIAFGVGYAAGTYAADEWVVPFIQDFAAGENNDIIIKIQERLPGEEPLKPGDIMETVPPPSTEDEAKFSNEVDKHTGATNIDDPSVIETFFENIGNWWGEAAPPTTEENNPDMPSEEQTV